ncbi:MAG: histidine phosphatase family protein [Planctomycetota bacterium]|nr:histidine phosphatase family protein [Planctomycetota bacterium]
MRIYLLRHASAEARGPDGQDDPARALTPKGHKQIRELASTVARLKFSVDHILCSPATRALETAQRFHKALKLPSKLPLTLDDRLGIEAEAEDAEAALRDYLDQSSVLLVGHEPTLSRLAGRLLGFEDAWLRLKKAGFVELRLVSKDPLRAELHGWLRPAHLRS